MRTQRSLTQYTFCVFMNIQHPYSWVKSQQRQKEWPPLNSKKPHIPYIIMLLSNNVEAVLGQARLLFWGEAHLRWVCFSGNLLAVHPMFWPASDWHTFHSTSIFTGTPYYYPSNGISCTNILRSITMNWACWHHWNVSDHFVWHLYNQSCSLWRSPHDYFLVFQKTNIFLLWKGTGCPSVTVSVTWISLFHTDLGWGAHRRHLSTYLIFWE